MQETVAVVTVDRILKLVESEIQKLQQKRREVSQAIAVIDGEIETLTRIGARIMAAPSFDVPRPVE